MDKFICHFPVDYSCLFLDLVSYAMLWMSNFTRSGFTNNSYNYHCYRWPYPFLDLSSPYSPFWYDIFLYNIHLVIFKLIDKVKIYLRIVGWDGVCTSCLEREMVEVREGSPELGTLKFASLPFIFISLRCSFCKFSYPFLNHCGSDITNRNGFCYIVIIS